MYKYFQNKYSNLLTFEANLNCLVGKTTIILFTSIDIDYKVVPTIPSVFHQLLISGKTFTRKLNLNLNAS